MNRAPDSPHAAGAGRQPGLPLKISGIVFWGSLLVGLAMALTSLRGLENHLTREYRTSADSFAYRMQGFLGVHPKAPFPAVRREARRLRAELGLQGVDLELGGRQVRLGNTGAGLEPRTRQVRDPSTGRVLEIRIYEPDLQRVVTATRKRMLIVGAFSFLLLGLILKWILDRVLSRPFLRMVETARRFSRGETDLRLDERRNDEFGFLARFINRALDYVLMQQEELREALARVRQSEAALFREKERAEVTLHSIGDAVITTDGEGRIDYLNPVALRLTGWHAEEIGGRPIVSLMRIVGEHSGEEILHPVVQALRENRIVELPPHSVLLCADGRSFPIADSAAPIHDRQGRTIGAVMVFHDVTYARQLERELSYHASHDALTGLCNRRQFELVLEQALEDAVAEEREHALCYLDLDQFKVVNDTCGHSAGDELLRQLAARLSAKVRESDMLARLGGDEFGVLLYGCTPRRAYAVAEELRNVICEFQFNCSEHRFQVGASIGVVAIDSGSGSVAELLSAADVACYAAKERGRNRVHVYQTDDHELQERRGEMRLVSRINRALQEGRFQLLVQDIADLSDDARPGYRELLVRLVDRDGGLLSPMSFIPAAERYGLMPSVDRWVVANACRLLAEESARDPEGVWAINLSGQSVCDEAFLEYVMHTVRESGVAPQRLCFEITETATIANLGHATRFMNVMHGMGCRFALDDFGSGLSSFGHLKQLPVDYLKIDGTFVRDMAEDPIDYAMVEAINRIGHVMGIRTIAEFVEDEAVLNALRGLGVDYAQGYWIAVPRPMAADGAVAETRVPGRSAGPAAR
jgi:diguanylate cyclase (GGDEF)-like protein/PAS domain S-box-containing protein